MKKVINKIISFLLALVVILSTMSFTISSHFCAGNLVQVSYFTKAKSCNNEVKIKADNNSCNFSKTSCCEDKIEFVKGLDVYKKPVLKSNDYEDQLFLAYFSTVYNIIYNYLPNKSLLFNDYSPPQLIVDFQVLNEVYLI